MTGINGHTRHTIVRHQCPAFGTFYDLVVM